MAWARGRITLDCGHSIGLADWEKLWVGASTYCPADKRQATVVSMSRIYEAKPSRDFQLGTKEEGEHDTAVA